MEERKFTGLIDFLEMLRNSNYLTHSVTKLVTKETSFKVPWFGDGLAGTKPAMQTGGMKFGSPALSLSPHLQ